MVLPDAAPQPHGDASTQDALNTAGVEVLKSPEWEFEVPQTTEMVRLS